MSTTIASYRDAVEQLAAAQKPGYGAPAYSRFVNRPLGRRVAAFAYTRNLTPNQVTGISAMLSGIAIVVLALAPIAPVTGVIVAVALALGYGFDAADGQLARLTGKGGPGGEWLDHVVDMAKTVLLPGAVVISLVLHTNPIKAWLVAITLGFAAVAVVSFFGWLLVDLLRRVNPGSAPEARFAGDAPLLRSLLRLPGDYGVQCWVFLLWGFTFLFWWAFGLIFAACLVILLAALPVWFRQAKSLGVAPRNH